MATTESVFIKDEPYVYYAQLASPGAQKFETTEDKDDLLKDKEYVMEVLVKTKELKKLRQKWEKTVKLLRGNSLYTAEEFEKRFKIAPPTDSAYETIVEEVDEDDNEYEVTKYETIKVRKYSAYHDGNPTRLVQIWGAKKARGTDRNDVPVSQQTQDKSGKITGGESTLLGNGTMVKIQLTVRPLKTKSGKDLQFDLFAVQVLELVEYVSTETEDGFDDEDEDFEADVDGFGDEDDGDDEVEEKPKAKSKAKPKKAAKKAAKKVEEVEEDDTEDDGDDDF